MEGTAYVAPQVLVDINHSEFIIIAATPHSYTKNSDGRDDGSWRPREDGLRTDNSLGRNIRSHRRDSKGLAHWSSRPWDTNIV